MSKTFLLHRHFKAFVCCGPMMVTNFYGNLKDNLLTSLKIAYHDQFSMLHEEENCISVTPPELKFLTVSFQLYGLYIKK